MLQRLNLVSERRHPRSEWRRPRMERRSLLLAMTLFCATAITLPAHALDTVKFMIGAIETNRPPVTLTNATPIARLFADTMILVVATNSPIQSVKDVAEHPSWKDSLKKNDWSAFLLTGDEFAAYVDAEHKRIGATLRALGVAK